MFTHSGNLVRWLKAPEQALSILDDNTDIHSHACGEYVLEQLQQGVSAAHVAQQLPALYLVKATAQRMVAYRRYRESVGGVLDCRAAAAFALGGPVRRSFSGAAARRGFAAHGVQAQGAV